MLKSTMYAIATLLCSLLGLSLLQPQLTAAYLCMYDERDRACNPNGESNKVDMLGAFYESV